MKGNMEERAVALAQYIIVHRATVRSAAKAFRISKSTVYQDVTTRLQRINPFLFQKVHLVLQHNKEERHIRGGMATREKYRKK